MKAKKMNHKSIFEERAERDRLWATHPARVYLDDIDQDLARRAFCNTSQWPEVRGEDFRRGYAEITHEVKQFIEDHAKTPEQKLAALVIFEDFRARHLALSVAYLHSHSRCASTFITGGSNFPVRQQEKRHRACDNHLRRLVEFQQNTKDVVLKKLDRALTPEDRAAQAAEDVAETLRYRVTDCAATIKAIKDGKMPGFDPQSFRSNLQGVIERAWANGHTEAARNALDEAKNLQRQLGITIFAARNRVWKAAEITAPGREQGEAREYEINGVTVEEDPTDNRLRLHFDGKPGESMRAALKSRGFKWSPRNQAWQRQLTNNARMAARQILKDMEKAA